MRNLIIIAFESNSSECCEENFDKYCLVEAVY